MSICIQRGFILLLFLSVVKGSEKVHGPLSRWAIHEGKCSGIGDSCQCLGKRCVAIATANISAVANGICVWTNLAGQTPDKNKYQNIPYKNRFACINTGRGVSNSQCAKSNILSESGAGGGVYYGLVANGSVPEKIIRQDLTFANATITYSGNAKSTIECSYLHSMNSTYCNPSGGPTFTVLTGVSISSNATTVSNGTATKVSFTTVLKAPFGLRTTVTTAGFAAALAAVNTQTGLSIATGGVSVVSTPYTTAVPVHAGGVTEATTAALHYKSFNVALSKYNCEDQYGHWNCDDCRKAYARWACAVAMPRCQRTPCAYVYPCQNLCYDVVRKCPVTLGFTCPPLNDEREYMKSGCNDMGMGNDASTMGPAVMATMLIMGIATHFTANW